MLPLSPSALAQSRFALERRLTSILAAIEKGNERPELILQALQLSNALKELSK